MFNIVSSNVCNYRSTRHGSIVCNFSVFEVDDASAIVVGDASAIVVDDASAVGDASILVVDDATVVVNGSIVEDGSIIRDYCIGIVSNGCRACIDDCIAIVLNGSIVYYVSIVVYGAINCDSPVIRKGVS